MAIVLTWLMLGSAVALLVWGVRTVLRWDGPWRWLALAVLLPLVITGARIVVDIRSDPTSHNLWPIEVLAAAVVSLVLLVVLQIGRAIVSRRAQGDGRG